MRQFLIWALIVAFTAFFVGVYAIYGFDPQTADFVVKCGLALGTLSAVLFALYGDYIKTVLDPIELSLELPKETNTVVDQTEINGVAVKTYVHHLVVRNLTPYKTVINCRVMLKKIYEQEVNGEWVEKIKFAVPRHMEWAPFEYSPDKRTFSKQQVVDFGMTLESNLGFKATWDRNQGGNVSRMFEAGKKFRFRFYVTADNYQKEKEFCFEVNIPRVAPNQFAPATITAVSLRQF